MMYITLVAFFVTMAISPLFFFRMAMLAIAMTLFAAIVVSGRWYWTVVVTENEIVGPKTNGIGKARLPRRELVANSGRTAVFSEGADYLASNATTQRISLWGLDERSRNRLYRLLGFQQPQLRDPEDPEAT
jgi:hypothetical protein